MRIFPRHGGLVGVVCGPVFDAGPALAIGDGERCEARRRGRHHSGA